MYMDGLGNSILNEEARVHFHQIYSGQGGAAEKSCTCNFAHVCRFSISLSCSCFIKHLEQTLNIKGFNFAKT